MQPKDGRQEQKRREGSLLKKAGRGLLFVASALVLPIGLRRRGFIKDTLKKLAIFGATYFVLQPLSLFLFPRAETVLKDRGIDPAAAGMLAPGKKIHVLQGGFAARAYEFMSSPWSLRYRRLAGNDGVAGYYVAPGWLARIFQPEVTGVYLRKNKKDNEAQLQALKNNIEQKSHGLYSYRDYLTEKEYRDFVFLHELRHCARENDMFPPGVLREGDADYKAAEAFQKYSRKEDIGARCALLQFFSDESDVHNTGLYVYAKMNGLPVPDAADIMQANHDAQALGNRIMDHMRQAAIGKMTWGEAFSMRCEIENDKNRLSELAHMRADLYQQAADYTYLSRDSLNKTPLPRIFKKER